MKKIFMYILIASLILSVLVSVVFWAIIKQKKSVNNNTMEKVKETITIPSTFNDFSITDGVGEFPDIYFDAISNFPSDKILGPVENLDDAVVLGVSILVETFGDKIYDEAPFCVYYDSLQEVWLVTGSAPPKSYFNGVYGQWVTGSLGAVLIRKTDGKVLAVWH